LNRPGSDARSNGTFGPPSIAGILGRLPSLSSSGVGASIPTPPDTAGLGVERELSSPCEGGFWPAAKLCRASNPIPTMERFRILMPDLRDHHGVARHQLYVLFGVGSLDHFLVVEGNVFLSTIRGRAQDVNRLFLGKIFEAAG